MRILFLPWARLQPSDEIVWPPAVACTYTSYICANVTHAAEQIGRVWSRVRSYRRIKTATPHCLLATTLIIRCTHLKHHCFSYTNYFTFISTITICFFCGRTFLPSYFFYQKFLLLPPICLPWFHSRGSRFDSRYWLLWSGFLDRKDKNRGVLFRSRTRDSQHLDNDEIPCCL